MVTSDPSAMANAIISAVIVIALMFYQRGGARHRPLISLMAYFTVLVYASVPFRYLFGLYHESHWFVVLVNVLICAAVLWARGNVARIIDVLRHSHMTKDEIFNAILGKEGGYVNHPDDKGGPTNWGITQAVARAHGFTGDMRNLTRQQALDILTADYWTGPRFDLVSEVSPAIAAELCDTGVNMGPSVQTKWFQRWLNVFNIQGSLYPDLIADGFIGPRTISALKSYLSRRGKEGELVMLRALNCSQGQRYLELAEQRSANETFVYGWVRERVAI